MCIKYKGIDISTFQKKLILRKLKERTSLSLFYAQDTVNTLHKR